MTEAADITLPDLLAGVIVVIMLRRLLDRVGVPTLAGFLALGFLLRLGNDRLGFLLPHGETVFEFLAGIGIVALLFRVGLESNLHGLIDKLPRAAPIWFGNVILSGVPAYLVADQLHGLEAIPSLFVATSLTATSVVVSSNVWREAGALTRPTARPFRTWPSLTTSPGSA